jgi:hypothetical protein
MVLKKMLGLGFHLDGREKWKWDKW